MNLKNQIGGQKVGYFQEKGFFFYSIRGIKGSFLCSKNLDLRVKMGAKILMGEIF